MSGHRSRRRGPVGSVVVVSVLVMAGSPAAAPASPLPRRTVVALLDCGITLAQRLSCWRRAGSSATDRQGSTTTSLASRVAEDADDELDQQIRGAVFP